MRFWPTTQGRRYARAVRDFHAQHFGLVADDIVVQDRVWEDWLALERGMDGAGTTDLQRLIVSDVADVYNARAIAILLSPKPSW